MSNPNRVQTRAATVQTDGGPQDDMLSLFGGRRPRALEALDTMATDDLVDLLEDSVVEMLEQMPPSISRRSEGGVSAASDAMDLDAWGPMLPPWQLTANDTTWIPPARTWDPNRKVVICLDLPGVDPSRLRVRLVGETLEVVVEPTPCLADATTHPRVEHSIPVFLSGRRAS